MALSLPSLPRLPTRVPSLSLSPAAVLNAVSLIASQLPKINLPTAVYAIVNADSFIPLTNPDSWAEILPRFADYQLSDYPVEGGGFIVANKVRRPTQVDVTLVKTGSDLARASWLEAIRQQLAAKPLGRYHILTPQALFQSLTITNMSFQTRQDRGQNMLYLDIRFIEVPQIETPSLLGERAVSPESQPTKEVGRVFATDASERVIQQAASGNLSNIT